MQFRSRPVPEHGEGPLADDGQLESLLSQSELPSDEASAAYVVSVGPPASEVQAQARLAEILGLAEANGHAVIGHERLTLPRPHPRTHLGPGTATDVAERARALGATLLILDAPLSPSQTRNLEDLTGLSVSDREVVILGVFLRHASSRAARIQVQIAQLEYLRPRIRGLGLDMDQQSGAGNYGRGAGETASELLARQIDERLVQLRRSFAKVERSEAQRRKHRQGASRVALVGYTNAGKTSLMNALSGSTLSARARPFETLDTTTRALTRHGGEVLLADTVGFIRDLPPRLVASFSTTLAEAREADLLVVVVDLSDPEWPMHLETTAKQLDAIGAGELPRFVVFNKADAVRELPNLDPGYPFAVVSAHDAEAMEALRERLIQTVQAETQATATLWVPWAATAVSNALYATCRVLESHVDEDGTTLTFQGPPAAVARVLRLGEEAGCQR